MHNVLTTLVLTPFLKSKAEALSELLPANDTKLHWDPLQVWKRQ